MSSLTRNPTGNSLIDYMSKKDSEMILGNSRRVQLKIGEALSGFNSPYAHVYFPLNGFISQIADNTESVRLSGGLVGQEGMTGASLALGINSAPWESVVYNSGISLRMLSGRWRKMLRERPRISAIVHRYLYVLMMQNNRMTTCGGFHNVDSRLARWLLMANDRVGTGNIRLTHEQLANMLGVRRSAISIAAAKLQKLQCIRYSRGTITVLDHLRLQEYACSCYCADLSDYERILRR